MRPIQPAPVPYELVEALHASAGWQFWRSASQLRALETIESNRYWGALPSIASLLVSGSADVRTAAARTTASLLNDELPTKLAYLSVGLYQLVPYEWRENLARRIDRSAVATLQCPADVGWAAFGLLSFHPNGWVREAAVIRLGELTDGREIPFLLLRSNDWVEVVSGNASRLVEDRINSRPVEQLTSYCSTVFAFRARVRGAIGELTNRLIARLARDDRPETFFELAARTTGAFRRWVISDLLLPNLSASHAHLAASFACDGDPIIRLTAWRHALQLLTGDRDKLLNQGLRDSWPPMRRQALELLFADGPGERTDILFNALLDTAAAVRSTARFYLEKHTSHKAVDYYRTCVRNSAPSRKQALIGLAETGDKTDLETIVPYLNNEHPALRRVAILTVGRLAPGHYRAELFSALSAKSPGVSKAAREVLSKSPFLLSRPLLVSLAATTNGPMHVCRNAIWLVRALPKWERILAYLELLPLDPEWCFGISDEIQRWLLCFNRDWEAPDKVTLESLRRAADTNRALLQPRVRDELLSIATSTPAKD